MAPKQKEEIEHFKWELEMTVGVLGLTSQQHLYQTELGECLFLN